MTLQRHERGRRARCIFRRLMEEKRERERKRKEAATCLQKYARGYAQRKVFKVNGGV